MVRSGSFVAFANESDDASGRAAATPFGYSARRMCVISPPFSCVSLARRLVPDTVSTNSVRTELSFLRAYTVDCDGRPDLRVTER